MIHVGGCSVSVGGSQAGRALHGGDGGGRDVAKVAIAAIQVSGFCARGLIHTVHATAIQHNGHEGGVTGSINAVLAGETGMIVVTSMTPTV